jgi:hypothetical protein
VVLVAGLLIVLASGAWTVRRSKAGILAATAASVKAAIVGQAGIAVPYLLALRRAGVSSFLGHSIYYWFVYTLAINLALSLVFGVMFGVMGALLGRGIARFRGSMDQPTRY